MGSYGRNFDFRVMPFGAGRGSRYLLGGAANIPIGAPVKLDGSIDTSSFGPDNAVLGMALAAGECPKPATGLGGVAVYEHAPAAYAGFDPVITNYSDIDFVPFGKLFQVVSGTQTKVVFTNTTAFTFAHVRTYAGRIMVAGMGGATSGDAEPGSYLTPGLGTDVGGYWATTATAANGWLVVTAASESNLEVEAKLTF